jgi:hypothetical protein
VSFSLTSSVFPVKYRDDNVLGSRLFASFLAQEVAGEQSTDEAPPNTNNFILYVSDMSTTTDGMAVLPAG